MTRDNKKRYDYCINCNKFCHIYGRDRCKKCYQRWYMSQPGRKEHRAKQEREYRKKYPERYRRAESRRSNTKRRKTWRKQYNKEYYKKNKEALKAYQVQYRKANPGKVRKYWRDAKKRKRGADGELTEKQWNQLVSFYCPDDKCLSCGKQYGKKGTNKLTIDHIVPLNKGGTHWPNNIQPLCSSCNSSKKDKKIVDYRPDKGEFARRLMSL